MKRKKEILENHWKEKIINERERWKMEEKDKFTKGGKRKMIK